MYKLYYLPGACSMALSTLLNELGQPFQLIKRSDVPDFTKINITNTVPVLDDNGTILNEGASIALHLMEKHKSDMLPTDPKARANALNWLMFANATMHPAYGQMFFVLKGLDKSIQDQAFAAGAAGVNKFWKIVDDQLAKTKFVCGDKMSMADIFLTVYANWNGYFPTEIILGENTKRMLKEVSSRPSFQQSLAAENVEYKAVA